MKFGGQLKFLNEKVDISEPKLLPVKSISEYVDYSHYIPSDKGVIHKIELGGNYKYTLCVPIEVRGGTLEYYFSLSTQYDDFYLRFTTHEHGYHLVGLDASSERALGETIASLLETAYVDSHFAVTKINISVDDTGSIDSNSARTTRVSPTEGRYRYFAIMAKRYLQKWEVEKFQGLTVFSLVRKK